MKRLLKADILSVVVLWLCLLPFQDQISLVCGHPLRVMATELAVATLQSFGSAVTNEGTIIHVGATDIAITDACSGIDELLAMVLVGWILARTRQRNVGWSLFAWAFAIPAVVFANALRLVVLVVLYGRLGGTVLTGAWHVGLGYAQVVTALLLMWGFGEAVRAVTASPVEEAKEDSNG